MNPPNPPNPPNQTSQSQNQSQSQDELPPLTSIAPSIFVPITSDLTEPFEKPASRIDRIRKVLENVDVHSAAVKANILHMFELEIKRTQREAKEQERANWEPIDNYVGITNEDFERMARNVEAPPDKMKTYNTVGDMIPKPDYEIEISAPTLREDFVRKVLDWVEAAVGQVEGYATHVEGIKAQYKRALAEALVEEANRRRG